MADIHIGFLADFSDGKSKVQDARDTIASAMQQIADAFEGKGQQSKKAIDAIKLAAEEMGVKVTGNVAEIVGALPGVAAAFEAAVPVLNLLALVDVLDQVVDKVKAWSEEMGGLTEDVKSGYNALVQLNGEIIKFNEGLEIQKHHIAEGVLSGVTRLKEEHKALTADADTYNARLRETETRIRQIDNQLHGTHKETETFGEGPDIGEREIEVSNRDALSKDQIAALEKEYEKLIQDSEQYRENIKQIQTIKLPSLAGQVDATAFKQTESELAQVAATHKKTIEDGIQLELDANRLKFANGQITAEQLASAEETARSKRYRAEITAINQIAAAEIAAAKKEDPTKIAGIEQQAREQRKQAELQYQDEIVKAAEKSANEQKKLLADLTRTQEQQEKEATAAMMAEVDRRVKDQIKAVQIQLDAGKAHKEALDQIENQRLEFDKQIGRISENEYEKRLTERLKETYKEARAELEIKLAGEKEGSAEYARIQAQITKLDDKFKLDSEQLQQQSLLRRQQKFHEHFQQISGAFTSALNSWIQGTESFGQAWTKMVQNMATKFISSLEQQLTSFIEHKLMEGAVHAQAEETKDAVSTESHAKEGARTARTAAQHAYDSVVDTPIVGPVLAPIAAAATFLAVEALGSAEGGQWEVPGIQPTILHPQEMVLPAGIASRMRDMVESRGTMGSRSALVFAPTIHALDAQGVDRVLTRHQRIFENRVDKILKKKGFFAK